MPLYNNDWFMLSTSLLMLALSIRSANTLKQVRDLEEQVASLRATVNTHSHMLRQRMSDEEDDSEVDPDQADKNSE